MRLHALEGVDEEGLALQVEGAILGGDGTFGSAARPEGVSNGSPGVLHVSAVQSCPCGTGLEARSGACDLKVDNSVLVVHALDGVGVAILRQLDSAVVGVETRLVLVEVMVVKGR